MRLAKLTTRDVLHLRESGRPICMMTAYDAGQAQIVADAGVDIILVGDSLGMVVLGYDTTVPVTVHDMIRHGAAVRRGAPDTMMVVDLPFLSYHQSVAQALETAAAIMQQTGADGVKLEGGRRIEAQVRALVECGVPVCAHIGLTPQSVHALGGFRVQGRDEQTARALLEDALALQAAGAFAIVLECVPAALAQRITAALRVPTIGIGAGRGCAGQVLVWHDALGMSTGHRPRFVKVYAQLREQAVAAARAYCAEVRGRSFPGPEHEYDMPPGILPDAQDEPGKDDLSNKG
ncbi:MAG: 3-methyl-2-oxobutanoate hydroxymethyltransferase [Firmicutes bacterium]|nr:3-methyl-2-oxobutanoate hydroxymethyltransferase [Bacillota bacterium]